MQGVQVVIELRAAAARDSDRTGSKAANLATLLQAGFPVPDGMVLTTEAFRQSLTVRDGPDRHALAGHLQEALREIIQRYGDAPLAVRSSALAEDLPDATFAGQYETVLDVRGLAALDEAVRRCWASATGPEATAYGAHANVGAGPAMAVLIQPMLEPEAAGVALGADPISGDRSKTIVSAVPGRAAALVSGAAVAEDWEVTPATAVRRSAGPSVLTAGQASAVAEMLWRVEKLLGAPQDMEWAVIGDNVTVLQARPMTALPGAVAWIAPRRGVWLRSIRLGEWLPEPVTPLFESWLLDRMEEQFRQRQKMEGGIDAPGPLHVCVNGWYFHSPIGSGRQSLLFRGFLRRPRPAAATVLASRRPAAADRLFYAACTRQWDTRVLLPYQRLVDAGTKSLPTADAAEIVQLVDGLADLAGDFFWSLVLTGGAAWRFEIALARFCHRYLRTQAPYQVLLGGLAPTVTPGHAVHSLDWIRETVGELPMAAAAPEAAAARHAKAVAAREAATVACEQALATRPRRLAEFRARLVLAQRYAALRAEHVAWFTLAWPLLRRCVLRLGEQISQAGQLDRPEDVFFVSRAELAECLAGRPVKDLLIAVRERRAAWERWRRLSPPLTLGKPPLLLAKVLLTSPKVARSTGSANEDALRGTPASPGRAAGPVRILLDPSATADVRAGDVLVVSAAVPALTPVFDRISALCVDGGSVAAHASLVAREYGIPAVTGLGNATSQLSDGTWVTVDGTAGVVHLS